MGEGQVREEEGTVVVACGLRRVRWRWREEAKKNCCVVDVREDSSGQLTGGVILVRKHVLVDSLAHHANRMNV
jgi:hypothetical protein